MASPAPARQPAAQLGRRFAYALEAAFDRVARPAIGVERHAIHALHIALKPDIAECPGTGFPAG